MTNSKDHLSLVENSQFYTFIEALKVMKWDIYDLLDKAQLPEDFLLNYDDGVILAERVRAFFALLEQQLPETELLQLTQIVAKKNALKILQTLPLQTDATIEQLLTCFITEAFRSAPESKFSLMEMLGDKWLVRHQMQQSNSLAISECYLLSLFNELICLVLQQPWQPTRLFLQSAHNQESVQLRCKQLFNNSELQIFSQREVTGIAVPETILNSPVNQVNLPFYASTEAENGQSMRTIAGALRYVLPLYLSVGRPSVKQAATLCGLHSRTLKRRLSAEGITYSALLDEIIMNLAKVALAQSTHSITEIGINLGYPYSNHFSRMFKRLSGVSPKQYREENAVDK